MNSFRRWCQAETYHVAHLSYRPLLHPTVHRRQAHLNKIYQRTIYMSKDEITTDIQVSEVPMSGHVGGWDLMSSCQ